MSGQCGRDGLAILLATGPELVHSQPPNLFAIHGGTTAYGQFLSNLIYPVLLFAALPVKQGVPVYPLSPLLDLTRVSLRRLVASHGISDISAASCSIPLRER